MIYLSILPQQEKVTISPPWSTTPIRTSSHHLPNAQSKEPIGQLHSSRRAATSRRNQDDKTQVKTTENDYKIQHLGLTNCTSGGVQHANILTGVGHPKLMS